MKVIKCYNGGYRVGEGSCVFKSWLAVKVFFFKLSFQKGQREYNKITKKKYVK